jgi:hypothetical protein
MKQNKILFANFVQGDRFELNLYLTYLFHQFNLFETSRLKNQQTKHPRERKQAK